MKNELTSMDVRFVTRELRKSLTGGIIRKIYQWGPELLIEIWMPASGELSLLIEAGRRMHLSRYKKEAPQQPPGFCMLLRKHLTGKTIESVSQHEFDRIVEIITDGYVLVAELFSKGNVILCNKDRNIIMPMSVQKWRDRTVKPGVPYQYPPSGPNFYGLDFQQFRNIAQHSDKEVVRLFAADFGFGSAIAEELCSRSGIPKLALSKSLDAGQLMRVFESARGLDRETPGPRVVLENGAMTDAAPFALGAHAGAAIKTFATFSEALDEFFAHRAGKKSEAAVQEAAEEEAGKKARISAGREEAVKKWEKIATESRAVGDAIYNNHAAVEAVLNAINRARDAGMPWAEIKQRATEEDAIKEISESDGRITMQLSGMNIELDIRKSPEENAAGYYEDMKWAKKKLESIAAAIEKPMPEARLVQPAAVLKPRKKWHERFRWFETSDGFLVVGGKDAATNERLVKKHAEQNDIVFHADVVGAPFVIIKSQGRNASEVAMKEAAEFAAAYSKAWAAGLGAADVYCVRPGQLSKAAPAGEFLPKGAFMVEGKRQWFRGVELKISVGVKISEGNARVVAGPVMAVRRHSDYFVTVVPGVKIASELAKELKNKIIVKALPEHRPLIEAIAADDWQNVAPSGQGAILG